MTLVSIPLMDRTGRRTLHLYGLGGMFIFSIFITISFLIKARLVFYVGVKLLKFRVLTGNFFCLCFVGSLKTDTESSGTQFYGPRLWSTLMF